MGLGRVALGSSGTLAVPAGAPIRATQGPAPAVHGAVGSIGSLVSTLDLASNTLYSGAATFGIQGTFNAHIPVYDPANGMIYVRTGAGTDISVVNAATFRDVANVLVPYPSLSPPFQTATIAVDNQTGYLYATNGGTSNVSVVSTVTNRVTGTIPVGPGPFGIAFDWVNGNFYTTNLVGHNVTVFSASLNHTLANINVGTTPAAIVYDGLSHQVFVANYGSANVSVISATSKSLVATVAVGRNPNAFAIDTIDDYVDVLNSTGTFGGVTVIAAASNTVHNFDRVGSAPSSLAFDSANQKLFVSNGGSNNLSIIQQPAGTVLGSTPIGHGSVQYATAYDPVNHDVYATSQNGGPGGTGNITVVNGATDKSVANITTSDFPIGVVVASSGDAYIVDQGSAYIEANITVLNESNNVPVASVPLFVSPSGATYDPAEKSVDVVDNGGSGVYRVDATTNRIAGVEGGGPVALPGTNSLPLVYDGRNGNIYVVDPYRTAVDVFTPAHTFLKAIPVGYNPTGIAFDNVTGNLFVSQELYGNVSIISGATNTVLGSTLKLGPFDSLTAVAYDPHNNEIYVADLSGSNVTAFDATTYVKMSTVAVGSSPTSLVVDTTNHTVFVANRGSGNLSVINDTTNLIVKTVSLAGAYLLAYDNVSNAIYNAYYAADSLSAVDASSYVALSGSPLPLGGLGGFYTEGIAFDPVNGNVYVTDSSGDALETVATAPTYTVTFLEAGLPGGTSWSVTLQGAFKSSTGTTIAFSEPAGTWSFAVGSVAGYTANVTSGNVVVTSGPKTVYIGFTAVVSSYAVTFVESGLPASSLWNVTLNSVQNHSTTNSIGFVEPGGSSYPFTVGVYTGYVANVTSGSVPVTSSPVTVDIGFTLVRSAFAVTFIESGLPGPTLWSVTFHGALNSSTTTSIGFVDPNGTWPFIVGAVTGFTANVTYGNVTVAGVPQNVRIGFSAIPAQYTVTFSETGLAPSTLWTVSLAGVPKGSSTTSIAFSEPNGSYAFTVGTVTGYSATPNSGSIPVAGGPALQGIVFTVGTLSLTVVLTASPANFTLGASTTLTATTAGGTPPFSYAFTGLPAGCSTQNTSSLACKPTASGTFTVNVTVTDSHGAVAHGTATLRVATGGGSGTSPSSSNLLTEGIILGVGLAAAALLILFFFGKRRRKTPPETASANPPPPENPPLS